MLLSGHLIKMPCLSGIWQREFLWHSLSCLFMLFHRSFIRSSLGLILVLIKPTSALFPDGKETYRQFSSGNPLSLRSFSFLNTSQGMKNSFCNLFGFWVWLPLTFFCHCGFSRSKKNEAEKTVMVELSRVHIRWPRGRILVSEVTSDAWHRNINENLPVSVMHSSVRDLMSLRRWVIELLKADTNLKKAKEKPYWKCLFNTVIKS